MQYNCRSINCCVLVMGTLLLTTFNPVYAKEWKIQKGPEDGLCIAMKDRLNFYTVADLDKFPENSCATEIANSYPKFKQPNWIYLDTKKLEGLVATLISSMYPGSISNKYTKQEIQEFSAKEGSLLFWKVRLLNSYRLDLPATMPAGPQYIIQLRYPFENSALNNFVCPGLNKPIGDYKLFFVNEQLTALDPLSNKVAVEMRKTNPQLIDDGTVFVGGDNKVVTLGRDEGFGPESFCEIYYR